MRFMLVLNMVAVGALLGFTAIRPVFAEAGDGIYTGTVVSVIDANTLRIAKDGGGEIRIRLLGSDQRDEREAADPSLEGGRAALLPGHRVHVEPVRWERGILEGHLWLEDGAHAAERSQTTAETTTTAEQSTASPMSAIARPAEPRPEVRSVARRGEADS